MLLDRQGRPRIRIGVSPDGPAISLLDEQGQERLQLTQSRAGSSIAMRDHGQPVAAMHLDHQSGVGKLELRGSQGTSVLKPAGVSMHDASDQQRIHLSLINGTFPVLGLNRSDQVGSPSVELTASDSVHGLKIHDRSGRSLFSALAGEDGSASVNLRHARAERSLQISNGDGAPGGPSLAFFAPAKQDGSGGSLPRLQLGLREGGGGHIRIVGSDGRAQFTAPPQ